MDHVRRQSSCLCWVFAFFMCSAQAYAMSLAEALAEALRTHPSVLTPMRQVEVARADRRVAQQQFFPTPSVSLEQVSPSAADPSYRGDKQLQLFRLQQPLWTAGRLTAGLDKSQAGIDISDANLAEARLEAAHSGGGIRANRANLDREPFATDTGAVGNHAGSDAVGPCSARAVDRASSQCSG
ncbi:MAG: TolC family protein [Betaproteobacteria bacterium]|nr:TolC family protein [Betaproteobacteria bacterium]